LYATTYYSYDAMGNLIDVCDADGNHTQMEYDMLSRKTDMDDPDMGQWEYEYDNNGNLTSQADAKSQTISMVYDALNRLTNKNYPAGSGMTNVVYSYDSIADGNYGKGKRTGMTDGTTTNTYIYDARGRQTQENDE
jgi:YD repeat-containing protein